MDAQNINAAGTEYAGDPEALGRPCTCGVH